MLDRLLDDGDDLYEQAYDGDPSQQSQQSPPSSIWCAGDSAQAHSEERAVAPLFWAINAVAVLAFLLIVICVCRRRGDEWVNGWAEARAPGGSLSDLFYARGLVLRMQQEEERKKETPERRKKRLLERFEERNVRMVVKESDFVGNAKEAVVAAKSVAFAARHVGRDGTLVSPAAETAEEAKDDDAVGADLELGQVATSDSIANASEAEKVTDREASGSTDNSEGSFQNDANDKAAARNDAAPSTEEELNISRSDSLDTATVPPAICLPCTSDSQTPRSVPNCCAVCLCPYEISDSLIFSSNAECQHAFHEECIMEWLVKMQSGCPCPCCRQEFIDLPDHKEAQAKTLGDSVRMVRAIDFDRISWV